MGLVNSEAFVGTRCRLYRKKDARIINAWVQYFRGNSIIVSINDEFECCNGEHYYVEAFGHKVKACLDTKLIKFAHEATAEDCGPRTTVTLRVEGQIQVADSVEQSRHLVEGMSVELKFGATLFNAVVRDVSKDGSGIVADEPWEVGLPVTLRIDSPLGRIEASGEVRYSKPAEGKFRIGIKLKELSRIDGSRWRRLLGLAA